MEERLSAVMHDTPAWSGTCPFGVREDERLGYIGRIDAYDQIANRETDVPGCDASFP